MRLQKIPERDQEGVLRWAVMKALSLLRIYRDELDEVSFAMRKGIEVSDLMISIEMSDKNVNNLNSKY